MKRTQDIKAEFNKEIESLKKTQSKINKTGNGKIGIKKKTLGGKPINRIQDMKKRISGVEDKVEEMGTSVNKILDLKKK